MSRMTPEDAAANATPRRHRTEIRVILVGRNTFARESVALALATHAPEVVVIHAQRPADATEILDRDRDVDLIGILFAEMTDACLSHVEHLHAAHPDIPILASAPTEDPARIRRVFRIGAKGVLPLGTDMQIMIAAMRLVAAGGIYVPPSLLDEDGRPKMADAGAGGPRLDDAFPSLTRRQRQVLAMLARGATNKSIGDALALRESTVKAHVKQILRKLAAGNRTEAALMASKALATES